MENADVVASKKAAEKVQECLTTSSNSASAALKLPKKSKGKVDTKPRAKKEAAKSPPHEQPQAKRSKRQNNAGDMIDD